MAKLKAPKRARILPEVISEEEKQVLTEFSMTLSRHRKGLKGLTPQEKIQYFADAVYARQNKGNPLMTAVPLKPFLWLLIQSGLVETKPVIAGLLHSAKFYSEEATAKICLPEKIVLGAKRKRGFSTVDMKDRLSCDELNILDYDKMFRMVIDAYDVEIRTMAQTLYQELVIPIRGLRCMGLAPQESVILGVNRTFYVGWYDEKKKKTPYLYMMLDMGSLAATTMHWPELVNVDWLDTRSDRKFVVDSGDKVSSIEYIVPMCLTSIDVFALDVENQVKAKIVRFISGARR